MRTNGGILMTNEGSLGARVVIKIIGPAFPLLFGGEDQAQGQYKLAQCRICHAFPISLLWRGIKMRESEQDQRKGLNRQSCFLHILFVPLHSLL